ncbi:MAG: trimethylamine methyltransferase family protein [Chloroflexota bacterium]
MRPKINVISENLIQKIVTESKRVLATVGIEVRSKAVLQKLINAGLPTDETGTRVFFPPDVVDKAVETSPKSFDLFDRDGNHYTTIGGNNVHFTPASSGLKILDHRTKQTRLANTADFVEYVKVADQLENIAYLATAFSTNDDIEADVSDVWRLYLCLKHSKKPIVSGAFTEHGVPRMAEMMQLFRKDKEDLINKPMSIFTITATGNFRYSEDSCQNLLDCVEWGIPIEIVPVTLMGLIAPVTLVGATVFHTVDVLAGITMAQIIKPGAPVLFGGAPAAFHMKEASSPMLGIDALHLDLAYVEVAKYLGLPTQSYMALSDSKFLDAQAGAETFGSALLAALAGVNSVSGPGMLDFVMVFSLPKLVMDNDLCGQALHLTREMEIIDDLPVDHLIDELMQEQHLITSEHTLEHWPNQLYMPHPVTDRSNRENWSKRGSPMLEERAETAVNDLLNSYQNPPLTPEIDETMRQIIIDGLKDKSRPLPEIPVHKKTSSSGTKKRQRKHARRRSAG